MLKVLIVDDEPLSIEGLKNIVDWGKLGYEICGTCENGKEAISLTKIYMPDVVITDMRMPVMDGLQLISHIINEVDKHIKFIILSGYSEFEYARKALQFGVKYYLLKPVFEEELTDILRELYTEIEQENRESVSSIEETRMAISSIIRKLIRKECSKDTFLSLYETAFKRNLVSVWCYILIEMITEDNDLNSAQHDRDINIDTKRPADLVINILKDLVNRYSPLFIVSHDQDCYGILVGLSGSYEDQKEMEFFSESLYAHLKDNLNKSFFIAVGTPIIDLTHITDSYNHALEALNYSFYESPNSLIFYNDIKNIVINYEFNQNELVNMVINAIEETDIHKVESILETSFLYFKNELLAPEIVKMYVKNVVYRSIKLIQNIHGGMDLYLEGSNIVKSKKSSRTMVGLKEFLKDHLRECCRILSELNRKNIDENSYRIEQYVKENFKKPVTIKEISKNLYINPVYLGHLFKRKFGITLKQYIHKLRIEEAKRLLKETSMKSFEIAEEIGYSNYNIFLQHFEKNTGRKPKDYKNYMYPKY